MAWWRTTILGALSVATLAPALTADVVSIGDDGRVVARVGEIPVLLALGHVALPGEPALRKQAVERAMQLAGGKSATVVWHPGFGQDPAGAGRVHLRVGTSLINAVLIEEGLAGYLSDGTETGSHAKLFAMLEKKARDAKRGVWGAAGAQPVVAAPPPSGGATPAAAAPAAKLPFCAELNGRYYYASDAPEVARTPANRLIYYRSEAEAKKAGKQPAPQQVAAVSVDRGSADSLFARGNEIYTRAVNLPASAERNKLYDEAFQVLTQAMQVYSQLVEKNPKDAALEESLRRTSQLRYGAMKQRTAF